MAATKQWGLRLSLGNAPNTPHHFPGVPGFFRPDVPTPVGEGHPISLGEARKLSGSRAELELVELKPAEAKRGAEAAEQAEQAVREPAKEG